MYFVLFDLHNILIIAHAFYSHVDKVMINALFIFLNFNSIIFDLEIMIIAFIIKFLFSSYNLIF